MKSILEQNFDELYAQLEERVKCIKPIKQVDTYMKMLVWTTLNEILTNIFGGTRFMWMISSDADGVFDISFVDKYRMVETKPLRVYYANVFVFPTKDELLNMTFEELEKFDKKAKTFKINRNMIGRYYGHDHWFHSLWFARSRGSAPHKHIGIAISKSLLSQESKKIIALMIAILDANLPVMPIIISNSTGIAHKEISNCYQQIRTNGIDRYKIIVHEFDNDISELYLEYCNQCISVINSLIQGDKHKYSRGVKRSLTCALNIKAIGRSAETQLAEYSESDLLKLRDLKCRLIEITTKGGKND